MNSRNIAQWAVANLRQLMREEGIGACVVADPVNVTYVSGYVIAGQVGLANTTAYALILPKEAILVAPASAQWEPPEWLELIPYEDYSIERDIDIRREASATLESALPRIAGVGKVAAELSTLPADAYHLLNACRGVEAVVELGPRLWDLRAVKCQAEVEAIRRAVRAAETAFAAVERTIRTNSRELDVYATCLAAIAEQAGGPAILDGDFVSGERSAGIGGPPTDRVLREGDQLIVDIYPRLGAYWADVTRTFVLGEPTRAQMERHAVLEEALRAGEKAIAPGVPTRELYETVRAALARAGLAEHFPHHAGHSVGLTPSEGPRIIPGSQDRLQAGMVITLEPGVYLPGEGGMRLEDNFLVTEEGAISLSLYPRKLMVLGSRT